VERHAHRDGAAGVAKVPLQRRGDPGDQRQAARPEALDESARDIVQPAGDAVEGALRPDQDGHRHVPTAALGGEQRSHCVGVEGVSAQSVDGVGRQHDEVAAGDGRGGDVHADQPIRRVVHVIATDPTH
jgi:hypothetical protein